MNGYLYSSKFTAGFRRRLRLSRQGISCTLLMAALLTAATTALAQVNTCNSLTLYGAAAASGLCKSLSPISQTHWVCELATGNPDIHVTFNATAALHLTVRVPGPSGQPPACEGNSYLTGTFPGKFGIQAGQPATICNVKVQDWVTRLNAVPPIPAQGDQCKAGFQEAERLGRITASVSNGYQQKCGDNKCQ